MKVTVTNTALLNTGDAAIMAGTEETLRRAFGPDVEIAVRDQQPALAAEAYPRYSCGGLFYDQAAEHFGAAGAKLGMILLLGTALASRTPLRKVAARLLPKPLAHNLAGFVESDLVVSAGGTYLVPHYRTGPKLLELLVARFAGIPYVLFTQSLGPFREKRRLARWLLDGAAAILVREQRSVDHLREIGVPTERVHICADAAFAMPIETPPEQSPRNEPSIGISVRHWPHFDGDPDAGMDRYLDAVARLTAVLIEEHGAAVTFISTCQGQAGYWTDDSRTAEEVLQRLPSHLHERARVDTEFRGPEELCRTLAGYDLYVSTRMHGAILALKCGTPVLPIAYEFKMTALFHSIGLQALVHDISEITAEGLTSSTSDLLRLRNQIRIKIGEEVEKLEASALAAVEPLRKAVGVTA